MSACSLGDGAGAALTQLLQNQNVNSAGAAAKTFGQDAIRAPAAALNWLSNRQNVMTDSTTILSMCVSNVVTNYATTCSGNSISQQAVEISCNGETVNPDGPGCRMARAVMQDNSGNAQQQPFNVEYNAIQLRLDASKISGKNYFADISACTPDTLCGKWKANSVAVSQGYACEVCQTYGIKQAQHVQFTEKCNSAAKFNNLIKSNTGAQVKQLLTNIKDITGELSGLLSSGSQECISTSIQNRINQKDVTNLSASLSINTAFIQNVKFDSPARSIYMSNVQQSTNSNTVASLVTNSGVTSDLYSDEETKAAQALLDKNASLEDLANELSSITIGLANMAGTTLGQMILLLGALAIIGALLGLIFIFTNPIVGQKIRSSVASKVDRAFEEK